MKVDKAIDFEIIQAISMVVTTNKATYDVCVSPNIDTSCEYLVGLSGEKAVTFSNIKEMTVTKHKKEKPMKINICSTKLDLAMLNERLRKFEEETNEIPYIFMNKETCETIKTIIVPSFSHGTPTISIEDIKTTPNFKGECPYIDKYIVEYKGKKVYKDDTLEFGEIELR